MPSIWQLWRWTGCLVSGHRPGLLSGVVLPSFSIRSGPDDDYRQDYQSLLGVVTYTREATIHALGTRVR